MLWTVVLEKTLMSPLDCKEIQPVHSKGNQSWIFIGRTDVETLILWPSDAKNWLIGKDPDAGKDWRQEEKGMTEYEMVGLHYQLDGHKFEQAPGDGDGQGSLVCCSPWGHKESDTTERLNWTDFTLARMAIFKKSTNRNHQTSLVVQFSSVTQLCQTLCNPMDCSMPSFPVHHQLPEFTQTHTIA